MLKVEDIHTYYGKSYILQGISLEVGEAEMVSLLGRNGAGKTTTLRSIIGLTPPTSGAIRYRGENIIGDPPFEISRKGISYVPEDRRVFSHLTVSENLNIATRKKDGKQLWTMGRIFETFPRLDERRTHRGNELSGGEQQMLTIARALMSNPELLLLDEPTEGLAPILAKAVIEMIERIKTEGIAILFVEQNVEAALELVNRNYILDEGKIVYTGEELNGELRKRYLSV